TMCAMIKNMRRRGVLILLASFLTERRRTLKSPQASCRGGCHRSFRIVRYQPLAFRDGLRRPAQLFQTIGGTPEGHRDDGAHVYRVLFRAVVGDDMVVRDQAFVNPAQLFIGARPTAA
ncbi:MAG: hypothetical protein Q7T82_08995, partial [Armatimonadota bacterium]|nr:hypothetical protein [Armatimonadota bacterium]